MNPVGKRITHSMPESARISSTMAMAVSRPYDSITSISAIRRACVHRSTRANARFTASAR
ncbi:MAG TPA: hypothetical protein VF541_04985 [Longimicrobium sp.]